MRKQGFKSRYVCQRQYEAITKTSKGSGDAIVAKSLEKSYSKVTDNILLKQVVASASLIKNKTSGLEPGKHIFYIHNYNNLNQPGVICTEANHGNFINGHVVDIDKDEVAVTYCNELV
tara:strand:+ start:250 stop:603 length:354 start_codon:yes stop_codon:yes gene_type:complete